MTTGLSLLCPLSWDWAPQQTLTYPLHPFSPQNPRAKGLFTSPKSVHPSAGLSIWHLPGRAGQWVVWGGWLVGLLEDWEGHRFLPSPLPPPAATGCRLWLPSSPMGGCNKVGVTVIREHYPQPRPCQGYSETPYFLPPSVDNK